MLFRRMPLYTKSGACEDITDGLTQIAEKFSVGRYFKSASTVVMKYTSKDSVNYFKIVNIIIVKCCDISNGTTY